jgi:hypothetical protein
MKNQSDPERLLHDIFGEASPPAFRDGLLEQTLRQVRRRNRVHQSSRGLLTMALLVSLPLILWKAFYPPSLPIKSSPSAFGVVRSEPLPSSMMVESNPNAIHLIVSSSGTVAFVESAGAESLIKEVTDQELLTFLAGRPAALVRFAAHPAELLFLNPADQNGFPVQ